MGTKTTRSTRMPYRSAGRRGEEGFALVVVILSLLVVSTLGAAGLALSHRDYRIAQSTVASTHAFYASDTGMNEYIGTQQDATDPVTYTVPDGTATVWGEQLLELESGRKLYRVVSEGTHLTPDGSVATRTIKRVAMAVTSGVSVSAAFTSGEGIDKQGTAGVISGYDSALAGDCSGAPAAPVAGVSVPPDGYDQDGGEPIPQGEPPIDDSLSGIEQLERTGIDWQAVVDGSAVTPDYVITSQGFQNWPDFGTLPEDAWPVIYIDMGSAFEVEQTVATGELNGRGTIIVRGDLIFTGNGKKAQQAGIPNLHWDGLILVGGEYRSNGYSVIEGALVAGLNLLLEEDVSQSDLANGTKEVKYHSCNLKKASWWANGGANSLVAVPGTWAESL